MLHWTKDKEKALVMTDVEGDEDSFYEQKSFICQFLEGTRCDMESYEGTSK